MGANASCCDARTQLDNIDSFGKIEQRQMDSNGTQRPTENDVQDFVIPPMSSEMKKIVEQAKAHPFFQRPTS